MFFFPLLSEVCVLCIHMLTHTHIYFLLHMKLYYTHLTWMDLFYPSNLLHHDAIVFFFMLGSH